MKKAISILTIIIVTQFVFLSCKTSKSSMLNSQVDKPQYLPVDKNWTDSLNRSTPDIKNALMKLYDNDINRFNKDFKLNLTQEEFNNLKTLSTETFRIDSADFESINEQSSIRPMLKLMKTEAECYLLKDSDIILFMDQHFEKGQWRVSGTGRIIEEVGNQIENLHYKENIKVHDVIVGGDKKNNYKKRFVIFIRNGQYFSIEYGSEVPLLQDLLKYKARLERNEIE
jgi:hypothetical protein